jgi:hypothetical protein
VLERMVKKRLGAIESPNNFGNFGNPSRKKDTRFDFD